MQIRTRHKQQYSIPNDLLLILRTSELEKLLSIHVDL